MTETSCAIGIVAHDTKPLPGKPDERKRPQRADGGGIFCIADAPMAFEQISDGQFLVAPTAYKFSEDPQPFRFRIDADKPTTRMRLLGEDVEAGQTGGLALVERVLGFLADNPGTPGSKFARGIRAAKEATLGTLRRLAEAGKVDSVAHGRAVL